VHCGPPSGGVALLRAAKALDELQTENGDQKIWHQRRPQGTVLANSPDRDQRRRGWLRSWSARSSKGQLTASATTPSRRVNTVISRARASSTQRARRRDSRAGVAFARLQPKPAVEATGEVPTPQLAASSRLADFQELQGATWWHFGRPDRLGVEPVSLGAPVLARHRYTRCVDDVGLDVAHPQQRASQKTSRPTSNATAMRSILCPAFFASS